MPLLLLAIKGGVAFLLIAVVGFVVFANVLQGPFIFDDKTLITTNARIQAFGNISQFFTTDITRGAYLESQLYRPLQTFLYMVIFHLFGMQEIAFHLSVLLLHLGNCFLVFKLLRHFGNSYFFSLLGSFFFLLHPVQLEAVSYISGIADPLGLFFCLGGVWISRLTMKHSDFWRQGGVYLGVVFLFLLALFSKESTIIFPGLLFAFDLHAYRHHAFRQFIKERWLLYLLLAAVSLGYFYFREQILPLQEQGLWREAGVYTESLYVRIFSFMGALWEYTKLVIWPMYLFYEKPLTVYTSFAHGPVMFGISLLVIWLVFGVYQSRRHHNRLPLFSFLWVFVAFLPVSGIVPVNAIYLEHWLYFPMVGLTVLLFSTLTHLYQKTAHGLLKVVSLAGIVLFLILYGMRDIQRNREWSDPIKFYENEVFYAPQSLRMANNLAMAYYEAGKIDLAVEHYQNAIARGDAYPQSHHNLANALLKQQKINDAIVEYYRALQMNPNFIYSHGALKQIYQQLELPERAVLHQQFEEKIQAGHTITFREINEGLGLPADAVPE